MNIGKEKLSGLLLFFGTVQYLFTILILAMVEPSYSISTNFISDLGIGTNALVFNASMIIWGGTAALAAFLLYQISAADAFFPSRLREILFIIAALCVMGAGIFPEFSTPGIPLHMTLSAIGAFVATAVIFLSYERMNSPFSYVQIFLGSLTLLTTVLLVTASDLGIGLGGMERMQVYTFMVWLLGLSVSLMNKSQSD